MAGSISSLVAGKALEDLLELRYGPITLDHLKPRSAKLMRNAAGGGFVDNANALSTSPPPQQP